jgi:hypothetical protein
MILPSVAFPILCRFWTFEEVWNQGNVTMIDEFVAPDFVEHALWPNIVWLGPEEVSLRAQISHTVNAYRDTTPDFSVSIEQLLDSDKVTVVTTYRRTQHPISAQPHWILSYV